MIKNKKHAALFKVLWGMTDEVENLLNIFKEVTKIDSKHDFVEDGLYKGCTIHYSNGITIFHPYIPLSFCGVNGKIQEISETSETRLGQRFVNWVVGHFET
jgi:hypothetical protein